MSALKKSLSAIAAASTLALAGCASPQISEVKIGPDIT
jgi:hypothetical protein